MNAQGISRRRTWVLDQGSTEPLVLEDTAGNETTPALSLTHAGWPAGWMTPRGSMKYVRPFPAKEIDPFDATDVSPMLTDLFLLLALILFNGVFARSEIAIVSSKRARLLQTADAGGAGAQHALRLAAGSARSSWEALHRGSTGDRAALILRRTET